MNRKILLFSAILMLVFAISSCKGSKKESKSSAPADTVLTSDTIGAQTVDTPSVETQQPSEDTVPKAQSTDTTASDTSEQLKVEEAKTSYGEECNPESSVVFSFNTLDGRKIDICHYRGKVVILDFWATWCGPCRMEISNFIDIQNQHGDKVQFIGLAVSDRPERVEKFAQSVGINYPVGMATAPILKMPYFAGIRYIPTTFIIDKRGRVRYRQIGYAPKEFFLNWIEKLYAEK